MSKGLLLGLVVIAMLDGPLGGQWAAPRATAVFPDGATVRLEIADTPAIRQRGLMFRQALGPNEGMVFLFERPGSYPFWMQNCLISIDIIWLDPDFRVLSIAHAVPPCRLPNCAPPCGSPECPTYPHDGQALFVIEVAAGFARQHRLKIGDRIGVQGLDRR